MLHIFFINRVKLVACTPMTTIKGNEGVYRNGLELTIYALFFWLIYKLL